MKQETLTESEKKSKVLRLIGLARKAGKVSPGLDATLEGMRNREVFLVCLAEDTGESTKKKLLRAASPLACPVCFLSTAEELGRITGGKARAVIGILDENFAKGMIDTLEIGKQSLKEEKQV